MARIVLIQPPLAPDELFTRGSRFSASVIAPLGLAYLASFLRKRGHECQIIDGIAEPISIAQLCAVARTAEVIGITVISTYLLRVIEVIGELKKSGITAPVVVGGPHVTAMPQSMLDYGADYAVVGEGEETFAELVAHITQHNSAAADIKGVAFYRNGTYIFTGYRDLIDPLDTIPLPARDLLPMHRYNSSVARSSNTPSHSLVASRGCPGTCSFCSKLTFRTKVRYFSVDRIVEEFFLLRDKYGARDVAVWDDNFVASHEVVAGVCDRLLTRGFDLSWSVESRIDAVDRVILSALKRAGCRYIAYGIESGSQRILDYIRKRVTLDRIRETVRMTKEAGIPMRGYFILGFPTETREEMYETIRFAKELDVDVASFTLLIPLPGTLEYKRAQREGEFDPEYFRRRIVPEFNFPDSPIYVPKGMTAAELLSIHRSAYNHYYLRSRMVWRKLTACVRNPGEFAALVSGGKTLLGNLFSSHHKVVKK